MAWSEHGWADQQVRQAQAQEWASQWLCSLAEKQPKWTPPMGRPMIAPTTSQSPERQMAFETDENGNIILCPMMGWETAIAYGSGIVLKIIYAEDPSDISNGGKGIQFVLNPNQAIDLADILRKSGEKALRPPTSGTTRQ